MKNLLKTEPVVIVAFVQGILTLVASFGFNLISPEQAAAIITFVGAAALFVRSIVYSPESAAELASTVLTADKTGSVSYKGVKAAKKVEGAAAAFIPPAVVAGLVALGFPPGYAQMVGPEAAKAALEAGRKLAARPLSSTDLKASRDEELKRRAAQ